MSKWTTRIELFGSPKVNKLVLYDPTGQARLTFWGLATDKPQRQLAGRIVDLLNLGDAVKIKK